MNNGVRRQSRADEADDVVETFAIPQLRIPATYHQVAVELLREAIVTGALPPGALLKDTELSMRLGLSSSPIREALIQLSGEGLVEIQPNKLRRVTPIDTQAVIELMRVQIRIWALGCEWGAPNLQQNDLRRLRQTNEELAAAIALGDARSALRVSNAFYLVLMQASNNRELVRISQDRIPLVHRFILLRTPRVASPKMVKYQQDLYAALERRDYKATVRIFKNANAIMLNAAEAVQNGELKEASQNVADPKCG